jgi:hypothetical protein
VKKQPKRYEKIDARDGRYFIARVYPSRKFNGDEVKIIGDHVSSEEADALLKLLNATNQGECK